jgi:hypothetical protein
MVIIKVTDIETHAEHVFSISTLGFLIFMTRRSGFGTEMCDNIDRTISDDLFPQRHLTLSPFLPTVY